MKNKLCNTHSSWRQAGWLTLQQRNTHKRQREGGEQGDLLMPAFMHGPASGFDMLARIRALCDFFAEAPLEWCANLC